MRTLGGTHLYRALDMGLMRASMHAGVMALPSWPDLSDEAQAEQWCGWLTEMWEQPHNLATLTASDCGLAELARELCERQAAILLQAGEYDADTAKLALQPLLIRDGHGDAAYHQFEHILTAAKSRTDIVIADTPVRFSDLTATPADHRTITQWLWALLLRFFHPDGAGHGLVSVS